MVSIGVVMLQGSRHAHFAALRAAANSLNVPLEVVELRTVKDLQQALLSGLSGIILPGGESTTMRLTGGATGSGLLPALFATLREKPKLPVLATCAGVILMCDPQDGGEPLINARVNRNAYGRQRESFQSNITVSMGSGDEVNEYPGIFIRAPRFESNSAVNALAHLGEEVVGVMDGLRMALTFHPELSGDSRFHEWLLVAAMGVNG